MGCGLQAVLAVMMAGSPLFAENSFDFRLSPGPRLVGTRADTSGGGQVHASLE